MRGRYPSIEQTSPHHSAGLLTLNDPAVRSDDLLARRARQEQRIAKLEKALDSTLQVVSKVGA